jgi:hypothetical protein
LGDLENRRIAMKRFVGSRRTPAAKDSVEEVRRLRRGRRLDRLGCS